MRRHGAPWAAFVSVSVSYLVAAALAASGT